MAWNEPGNNDKDPWSKKGGDGPPDLDEVVKNFQRKMSGLFGGGSGSSETPSSGGGKFGLGFGIIAAIAFVVWILSGIYIVGPAERGAVLRFGAYSETTMPGPHWHLPMPIEKVEIVNVSQILTAEIGYRSGGNRSGATIHSESLMLTKDENIIDLKIAVQYRIKDAAAYLFNVRNPDLTLRQVTESAVRETVGKSEMDFVLTQGRNEVASQTETLLQSILDEQETGLIVTTVNMQDVQPPEQVQAAFADVVKAREDEVRQKNEAEAYANDVVPKARGAGFRLVQEAQGYKSQIIAKAQGETSRFLQVMQEYEKAPEITSERLYLEAMENVYSQSQKVMIDLTEGSSNVLYLPLDRMGNRTNSSRFDLKNLQMNPPSGTTKNAQSPFDNARSRGVR